MSLNGSSDQEPSFLFVYGLLMRGFELHGLLSSGEFVGEATIEGRLISLGDYPGLLDGSGQAHGELYRFDDIRNVLPAVDAVERYNPENLDSSLYIRIKRTVWSARLGSVLSWLYLYNGAIDAATDIGDGDWRRHIRKANPA